MYVSRLIIKNYRSIKNIDLTFTKGKNVIVGRNNAGKSNIVKALDIILGEKSPTYQNTENITENDFYCTKIIENDAVNYRFENELYIFCELTRDRDQELNFDEINKSRGFYKLVGSRPQYSNAQLDTEERIPRIEESDGGFELFCSNVFDYDIDSDLFNKSQKTRWVNSQINNQLHFEEELSNKHSIGFLFRAAITDGLISKDLRFLYRENKAADWILTFKGSLRNELLQSAIIPSFRDPSQQLRLNQWSWYGKLMRSITTGSEHQMDLEDALKNVKTVGDRIFSRIKDRISTSSINIVFPGTDLHFQFNNDVKRDIYKNCAIHVDDGIKTDLSDKGSGIQSAIIIGLFTFYVKELGENLYSLLCVEEPELYLHPHARRVISRRLDEFADNKNQVIITTHSSEFISSNDTDLNIVLVKRNENNSTVGKNLNLKDRKSILLDSRYNEVFFADSVIICEGFDSYLIDWVSKYSLNGILDENNVSIIPVGGKDKIVSITKLLVRLGLKVYIFTDFDFLLRDKSDDAEEFTAKKHDSIESMPLQFFSQSNIYGDQAEIQRNNISVLRSEIKTKYKEAFYTAKSLSVLPNSVEVETLLTSLRSHGIYILDDEIENLVIDRSVLNSYSKLDLSGIFKISEKLVGGSSIDTLISTSGIVQFINKVIAS
jgi:putative ATP-dependent endonuclease of OLD family